MKNKKVIISLIFVVLVLVLGFGLYTYYKVKKQNETNFIITIAEEHLQKYVHNAFPNVDFFSMVKKVEVVDGECEANYYWQNWGNSSIESSAKYSCWIVRFYYSGATENSHLAVYIDKNTHEVIGGTQTK